MRILSILLIMVSMPLHAQETIIKIVDGKSGEAIQFANVCIESLDGKARENLLSDKDGHVKKSIAKRSSIAISSLGYSSELDTINPGETKTITLFPTVYNVDEVVITGQFKAIKADKSIYKVEVINNAQIKSKAANNLAELLSTELNLRTSMDAALGANISIQGLSGEHVKILVDGVPVIGRQSGILDLSQVVLSNADHIEIIEGPMSVVYGSNALAGAINIITREPNHGRILGKINTYYESVGVYNADLGVTYRRKHHLIGFNGGRNFFAGYSVVDTSRVDQWKPKAQYFADINYAWSGEHSKLKLAASLFYEDLRNKDAVNPFYTIQPGNVIQIGYRAFDEYHYTRRWNSRAEFLHKFSENLQIENVLSYSDYRKVKNTFNRNLVTLTETPTGPAGQDTTHFGNVMLRSTMSKVGDHWLHLHGGLDASIETASGKRLNGNKRIDDYALFSSIKLFPAGVFNVQAGLRAIYNSKYSAPLVYALNLKYSPSKNLGFRASYGKGFRAPALKELYLEFIDLNHHVSGNSDLKAENSNNFNLSVNSIFLNSKNHIVGCDVTLFYNIIHNKIDFKYDMNNPTWAQYFNIEGGPYKAMGADLKLRYKLHPRFNLNLGANHLIRSQVANLDAYYRSTDYSADFDYKNLKYLFRIALFYKYTDDWYTTRSYFDKNNVQSRVEDGYMKGYHTMDLTLSRPFLKNSLEIFIGAKNIFNNKNVASYGSAGNVHGGGNSGESPVGWGRTYFIRLSYNFIKY